MKIVVQRCKNSSVTINNQLYNEINNGMCILVGFTEDDNETIINKMIEKLLKLRIFDDETGIMNKSILDIKGEILAISQFTLYADPVKGNRPSYIKALNGTLAKPLYEYFINELNKQIICKPGIFGADMLVSINNDGPVTIILDSKEYNF